MRKFSLIFALLGVLGSFLVAVPAQAVGIGNEGCTPGYWKNHTENWQEVEAGTLLTAEGFDPESTSDSATFLDALNYKGGSGLSGAEQILLRAAAAAYLNAIHDGLAYPLRRGQIVMQVNAAIDTGSRAKILKLATKLDNMNNLGCPLN